MLLHRPGVSALHKGPDGLSRNVEGRDQLILAKSSEWTNYRKRIRGICDAIASGEADDDEPEALTVERVEQENPEKLRPLPYEQGLAVSLKYEHGNQAHYAPSPKHAARGDNPARPKTKSQLPVGQSYGA